MALSDIALLYNACQCFGWFRILYLMLLNAAAQGWDFDKIVATNHFAAGEELRFFQKLAMLEIAFSIFGVVKSSLKMVCLQLLVRNIVVLVAVPAAGLAVQQHVGLFCIYVAWTLTEIIRFPWLLSKGFAGAAPPWLDRLRYFSPILLYPLGGLGEGWTMWNSYAANVPPVDSLGLLGAVGLPPFPIKEFIVYVYFPLYVPGFAALYVGALRRFFKGKKKKKKKAHRF